MKLDVPIHALRKTVVHVARVRIQQKVCVDRTRAAPQRFKVRFGGRPSQKLRRQAARLEQAQRRARAVVLALHPRQRISARTQRGGPNMWHAVRGANHFHVAPQLGGRCHRRSALGLRGERRGCQRQDDSDRAKGLHRIWGVYVGPRQLTVG